jgi:geranylgeranyl diphosphate synthase, type I
LSDWLSQIYQCLLGCLVELPADNSFRRDLEAVLERAQAGDELHREGASSFVFLPLWVCLGLGGQERRAILVAAAWRALHLAAQLFDRVQDNHRPPPGSPLANPAQTLSVATALLSLAGLVLANLTELEDGRDVYIAIRRCLDRAILNACAGQHADLAAGPDHKRPPSVPECQLIMAGKSGRAFAAACEAGAVAAGSPAEMAAICAEFGYNLGIMGQIADDCLAVTAPAEAPISDLAISTNLAVAYTLAVLPAERSNRLSTLLAQVQPTGPALSEAQAILRDAGALLFLAAQSQIFRGRALAALNRMTLAPQASHALLDLLDGASLLPGKPVHLQAMS